MSWKKYEDAAEKGPWKAFVTIGGLLLVIVVILMVVGRGLSCVGEGMQVAQEEFGPRALLKKYELFKDMSASLDKLKADIGVYETRVAAMEKDYEGTPRKDWDRTDMEQMSLWRQEVAGVKAQFNGVAAEYNAAMSKFNYAFCNVGSLPEGATEPLPREYKTYISH